MASISLSCSVSQSTASFVSGSRRLQAPQNSRVHTSKRFPNLRVVRAADGDAEKPAPPKVAKGNIVKVDKEQYLASVEFLAVDHPPYFTGLDYIYEARGEILDIRTFETGDFALVTWTGIPTAPAWLPTKMLVKAPKLEYKRV